jgi:hypothetical protein
MLIAIDPHIHIRIFVIVCYMLVAPCECLSLFYLARDPTPEGKKGNAARVTLQ